MIHSSLHEEHLLLVNENDEVIGTEEKLTVHQKALRHRAVSGFWIHNSKVLLQQRSECKYHSGGLWSNTVCTHPLQLSSHQESTEDALRRGFAKELGITFPMEYTHVGTLTYCSEIKGWNGINLWENEIDYLYVATIPKGPVPLFHPHPLEVQNTAWVTVDALVKDLSKNPEKYSVWLPKILMKMIPFLV